jgi:acyl-CoA dehydrogenase
MPNFFFNPAEFPEVPRRNDPGNDDFLFNQGATKGLGKTRFHDYNKAYGLCDLPNVTIFKNQIETFKEFMMVSLETMKAQSEDIDFLLNVGELFTLVAYGQLILENRAIDGIEDDLIEQIFDFMIRDFSKFSLQIYGKRITTEQQQAICLKMIQRPVVDEARYNRVWENHVYALKGTYVMNP